eukprot:COSAG05_NODE_9422_length_623_cov_1.502857_1_plen_62_part_10
MDERGRSVACVKGIQPNSAADQAGNLRTGAARTPTPTPILDLDAHSQGERGGEGERERGGGG